MNRRFTNSGIGSWSAETREYMLEKKFVKVFRIAKIIQLCFLLVLEGIFFIVLFCNPSLTMELYSNKVLFALCSCTWLLMLFNLTSLLYDFFQLRHFAEESHALNRAAFLDNLTGIPNRHGLDAVFQTYDNPEALATVGCFLVTISNLKETNESLGHQTGDIIIREFCAIFEQIGDSFGVVGRNGGNEYVLVINNCSDLLMKQFIKALEEQIAEYNKDHMNALIQIKYAYVLNTEEGAMAFTQLLTATYNKLHA